MKKFTDLATTPPKSLKKEQVIKKTKKFVETIHMEQHKLFAEHKRSLLIILQGMDASGKDGVIKQIFSSVNPQGVSVASFKKPSFIELSHDFLWRIHNEVPAKGMIKIFNRSHYEDILVPSVNKTITDDNLKSRARMINEFEEHLVREGTVILKFYLHISKDEQKIRLEERISNKLKQWKYNASDFETRKNWDKYMKTYQFIFKSCNKVKWTIIPSDKNWYKEYLVAKLVAETLTKMKLKLPEIQEVMKSDN